MRGCWTQRLRGGGTGEAVEAALVIDGGARFGPDALEDGDIFIGAGVAVFLATGCRRRGTVLVVAAADDVNRRAAVGHLVKRGELAGGERGGDETGTVGQQEAQLRGMGRGGGGKQETIRAIGEIADQHLVEATSLGRLGKITDVTLIPQHGRRRLDFRCLAMVDHADEFDCHSTCSRSGGVPKQPITGGEGSQRAA